MKRIIFSLISGFAILFVGTAIARENTPSLSDGQAAMLANVRQGIEQYRKNVAVPATMTVMPGLDVLVADRFKCLEGKRVGVISNHTGNTQDGKSIVSVLREAPNVKLVAIFSPEHGFGGTAEGNVNDSVDGTTGFPIYSLHGKTKRPTPESLENVDVLVFDIQDVGARFYTYISTMLYCMEEAAKTKISFVVLDRPNPIRGDKVEGPIADEKLKSFVACHPIPIRHGMTVGELAVLFNIERNIGIDLHVVPCLGWKRSMDFEACKLRWLNPSPNMRSLTAEYLYTGSCLVESSNMSVGRGTETPFEWIAAPWINAESFVAALRKTAAAAKLEGVRFEPCRFTPKAGPHREKECSGVRFVIENRETLCPVRMGVVVLTTLRKEYPEQWNAKFTALLANANTEKMILDKSTVSEIEADWKPDFDRFLQRREKVLLY